MPTLVAWAICLFAEDHVSHLAAGILYHDGINDNDNEDDDDDDDEFPRRVSQAFSIAEKFPGQSSDVDTYLKLTMYTTPPVGIRWLGILISFCHSLLLTLR